MLKKEIRIAAKLDTGEFDKTVGDMQRKMKEIYSTPSARGDVNLQDRLAKAGYGSAATDQQRRQADIQDTQKRRSEEEHFKKMLKSYQDINKELDARKKIMDDLEKTNQKMFTAEKQQYDSLLSTKKRLQDSLGASLDRKERPSFLNIAQSFQRGGISGGLGAMGIGASALGYLGLAGAAGAMGMNMYNTNMVAPQIALSNNAQATQIASSRLVRAAQGAGAFEDVYSGNRIEAESLAKEKYSKSPLSDIFSSKPGSILGNPLIVGALTRKAGLKYSDIYESGRTSEYAQNIQSNFENLKQKDPLLKIGVDYFAQNGQRDLGVQRSLGMNQGDLMSFYNQGNRAGFTRDQLGGAAAGVLGAGGSTRMAQGAAFTNRMQSVYNMTNAAQDLGSISGTLGDAGASQNTYLRIMSEAVRLGFDKSQYAEENRKFTSIVAQTIGSMGVRSEGKASEIASQISSFVTGNTMRDIGIGQSNFDVFQSRQIEGGSREYLRLSSLSSKFKGLNSQTANSLASMPEGSIDTSNPEFQYLYEQVKKTNPDIGSISEFKTEVDRSRRYGQSGLAGANLDKQISKLRSMRAYYSSGEEAMKDPEFQSTLNEAMMAQRFIDEKYKNAPTDVLRSSILGQADFGSGGTESQLDPTLKGATVQDQINKYNAAQETRFNESISRAGEQLSRLGNAAEPLIDAIIRLTGAFTSAYAKAGTDVERSSLSRQFNEKLNQLTPESVSPRRSGSSTREP
jgi:hypothetical protein